MDDWRKVFFSSGGRKDLLAELTEPNYSADMVAPQLGRDGLRTSNYLLPDGKNKGQGSVRVFRVYLFLLDTERQF